jgi:hypothetical protein
VKLQPAQALVEKQVTSKALDGLSFLIGEPKKYSA